MLGSASNQDITLKAAFIAAFIFSEPYGTNVEPDYNRVEVFKQQFFSVLGIALICVFLGGLLYFLDFQLVVKGFW